MNLAKLPMQQKCPALRYKYTVTFCNFLWINRKPLLYFSHTLSLSFPSLYLTIESCSQDLVQGLVIVFILKYINYEYRKRFQLLKAYLLISGLFLATRKVCPGRIESFSLLSLNNLPPFYLIKIDHASMIN